MAARKLTPRSDRQRLSLDEVRSELNKKYDGIIISGSELKGRVIERATTGSLAFDMMLGGGFPLNHWNEIIGNPSSGKTSMLLKTVAANQALDPEYFTLWIASEHFVVPWAESAGVDMDRMEIVETGVMEHAYEIVIKYLDNRLCDCIVIDSFPALTPSQEDEASMEEWQVGLGARLTGKFFRKAGPAQKRSLTEEDRPCLLLVINQWRDKIGVMFGDPRTTPGGKAKDYFYSTRVEVKRDEWIAVDKKRVGITMRAHTIKNKTAPVERVAGADFYFEDANGIKAGNYDEGKDLYACGIYADIIEQRGSSYTYRDQTWRGKENVIASLREDLDLRAWLRYDVLRSIGVEAEPPEPPKKVAAKKAAAPAKRMVRRGTAP